MSRRGVLVAMQLCRSIAVLLLLAASLAAQSAVAAKPTAKSANSKAASSRPELSQEQIRTLIRKCADNDLENDKRMRDYTYVERQQLQKVNGKGEVKSTESETYDVMEIYGEQVNKLTAKNDKPLSAKDAQKEDGRIQKLIDKRKDESESDRRKRLEKKEKDREDELQFVHEVADAYNFTLLGTEMLDGRDNYVIDAEPKPGYKPVHKEAKVLPKTRFRVWIDKDDAEVSKLDMQFIDAVSFGLFLARIHKGSELVLENTRVNNEVWLQQHVTVNADVRLALVKNFDIRVDITDRDYKKFRTDTRIVPIADSQPVR